MTAPLSEERLAFAEFVTEPSQPGDGPPEWPKGATSRIVGIRCPECGHESYHERFRNNASFMQRVRCESCDWQGVVPF